MNVTNNNGGQTIQGVETAFMIIESLESKNGATVSEVADELGLATSTTYVYFKTLRKLGYIKKDNQRYQVGPRFLKHGGYARKQLRIYNASKKQIDKLADETNELVSLGIDDGGQRVVIYRAEGENAVYDQSPTGDYTHMHWSALGKAILAHLPDEQVEEIVEAHGLPEATKHTITDKERLIEELEQIREIGYSIEDEERELGIRSIAVPVISDGTVEGAISVAGPKNRITDDYIDTELVEDLHNSVNIIELRFRHY
ncbi:IclR family transcriptional regulator [Haloferax profundi]|uniref:IclR family transcriptional regulator n=1 Tax=Haloferax profundi TaxID=1544718 RepID=A0A0W1RFE8_9EURY|nr:IclR family transcriptional regulator [Haloferax profundi]KTG12218.1 IclR family transcriptional regulator [Haloferax profundi]